MRRINLYPSPLTPLINDGKGDVTHGDYDVAIDNLEAGAYVFAADIQNSRTQTGINVMLFDSDWTPLFNSDKIGHIKTTFTLNKPARVLIRAFQAGVTISNVSLERADTYATAAGGGASELLRRADRAILTLRRVTAGEDRESMHRPQGAHGADNVGRHFAYRHQGGERLANRLRRQLGLAAVERQDRGNGCLRTGRWNDHVPTGQSFLRGFRLQGIAGLAAMLASRTVGGADHGFRLLRLRHCTLLAPSLGVVA